MSHFFNLLFSQYSSYDTLHIYLEAIAVFFGLFSVLLSQKNNVHVFTTGMISTAIFVYLLFVWNLIGDMMINAYYFIMSIYGIIIWGSKKGKDNLNPISRTTRKEQLICLIIFFTTIPFIVSIYHYFGKWTDWTAYVDTFTTAIFFVGMWLMAKRKIENWILWIVGDIISIPLYFYKGLTLTSIQYLVFTIMAFYGYKAWKNHIKSKENNLSELS